MTQVRKRRVPATPREAARRRAPVDALVDALLGAELFKALADPTRLRLLACIAKCARPCAVTEVAACCDVDLSVVSRHLALLARAGALRTAKDGRTVRYAVNHPHLAGTLRGLADALDECRACGTTGAACKGGGDGCC